MKRQCLRFTILAVMSAGVHAQSSVQLYGTLDVNAKYIKNTGSPRRLSESTDGLNSSQLGFRGTEDLGSGLSAGFTLLAGTNEALGTTNSKFFNRRSTLSVFGPFGEVRLGRDYIPTFWNQATYDVFGFNGIGNTSNVVQLSTPTLVRADNAIQYLTPSRLGGFYAQAMAAAGEGGVVTATASNPGRLLSARIGYAVGPLDVGLSAAQQRYTLTSNSLLPGQSEYSYDAGASYDFNVVKIMGYIHRENANLLHETRGEFGFIVPVGTNQLVFGYNRSKLTNDAANYTNSVWIADLRYIHNLSKRTAIYADVASLNNGARSQNSLAAAPSATAAPIPGGTSKGFQIGVRHFF